MVTCRVVVVDEYMISRIKLNMELEVEWTLKTVDHVEWSGKACSSRDDHAEGILSQYPLDDGPIKHYTTRYHIGT